MRDLTLGEIDKRVYEELAPWLPAQIVDCHVHIGLREHMRPASPERMAANWALEVGIEQSWEQLHEVYRVLFPKQKVFTLAFGGVFKEVDIERNNDYVLDGISDPGNNACGLIVTRPEQDASEIADAMTRGYLGIKPYPELAPDECAGPSIFDFVPRSHLAVLNELGGILMLHLPRKNRLADPDNVREILEISDEFPAIKMIIAHIGRSFCLPTVKQGLPHFVDRENIYFDTSANLNTDVFRYAFETIGADRLLYGSDIPITLMRGVREHIGDKYINYTDAPYSWNVNRKSPQEEANYTYFLYEEIRAIIKAVDASGAGEDAIEKIMYTNAAKLLKLGEA